MLPKVGLRCLVLFLAGLAFSSRGQPLLIYNTPAGWSSAVTAPVLVNFENIVPANAVSPWYPTPPGVTVGGIRFDIPAPDNTHMALMILGNGYYERPNAQLSSQGFTWASTLTVTLPAAVRGAAFSIWGFGAAQAPHQYNFTLDTSGSASTTQNGYQQPSSFLGLVSETPFTTVTIRSANSIINLDYVNYAVNVPEPRTPGLFAAGIIGLLSCRWTLSRQRKNGVEQKFCRCDRSALLC